MYAPNLLIVALGACVLLVASCGPSPPSVHLDPDARRPVAGMRQLEDVQLRYLVRGTTMSWANPDMDTTDRWVFGCNGEWSPRGGLGGRAPGTYTLENGEICVTDPERRTCHAVFRASDGLYFISGFGGDASGETVLKVRFEDNREIGSCR